MSRRHQAPKCSVASHHVSKLPSFATKPWPKYTKYNTMTEFFDKRRRQLLRKLDQNHALRARVDHKTGQLLPDVPTNSAERKVLTDEAVEKVRKRKRHSDPDDARSHLQGSQLVRMWNTDHQSEEHWQDFDRVRNKMVSKQRRLRSRQLTLLIDACRIDERRIERKCSADSQLIETAQTPTQDVDVIPDHQSDQDWNYEWCLLSKPPSKEAHGDKEICRVFADLSDSVLPRRKAEPASYELPSNKEVATES